MKIKEQLKQFKNKVATIFTSVLVLILFSCLFVGIGIDTELDAGFWTRFFINFMIMIAVTMIWYTTTKQKEAEENKYYKKQRLAYSILMDRISSTNNFKGLKEFCAEATEKNKLSKIKHKLDKYNIDFNLYEKYQKEPDALNEDKYLSDEQKKVLKNIITNGLSYKFLFWRFKGYDVITDNQITNANDGLKQEYDLRNSEKSFDFKTFSLKTLSTILSSIGIAMIVFTGKGFDLAKLAQILSWLGFILYHMFQAINSAKKAISVHRTNYFKGLRTFLEEFCGSKYYDNTVSWTAPKVKGDGDEE